jgi:hypothetical protein
MYDEPASRPRSSCQHRVAQEDHTPDREFPQSLKQLIKHRNSFSKPLVQPGNIEQRDHQNSTSRKRRADERSAARDTDPRSYNHSHVRHPNEGQEHLADANSDNESFRSVATRERLAFGIPPSESDEMFNKDLDEPELSHADSDMSSINDFIWKQAQDEMDFNPDRVLRKLNVEKEKTRVRKVCFVDSTCH